MVTFVRVSSESSVAGLLLQYEKLWGVESSPSVCELELQGEFSECGNSQPGGSSRDSNP
jgi:hypothetical protein